MVVPLMTPRSRRPGETPSGMTRLNGLPRPPPRRWPGYPRISSQLVPAASRRAGSTGRRTRGRPCPALAAARREPADRWFPGILPGSPGGARRESLSAFKRAAQCLSTSNSESLGRVTRNGRRQELGVAVATNGGRRPTAAMSVLPAKPSRSSARNARKRRRESPAPRRCGHLSRPAGRRGRSRSLPAGRLAGDQRLWTARAGPGGAGARRSPGSG
jgi:hypothetical protein